MSHLYKRLTYFYRYDRMEMITNECKKKLDKLCKEQLHSGVKTYDEALDFLREFTCVYDKCKSDKEYVPGLSHYDFMYWVNPIREAFAENDYKKAVEKLIDTYMEQNAYLYQSRVKIQ